MKDGTEENLAAVTEASTGVAGGIIPRCSDSRFLAISSLVLFSFCLATRIPLRTRLLSGWDPVQFALAIHHFDILHHQPHPPGYLLFVGLAKLMFGLVHDDNLALTLLAAIFSALSTVLILLLAFYLCGRRTALLASALWVTCPLLWFHGLVGEVYTAGGFGSLATALAVVFLMRSPSRFMAAAGGAVYALAAGLRPDQLLLLAPLFLFPFLCSAACRRRALYSLFPAIAVYAAWYIPTVLSVGGYSHYTQIVGKQFSDSLRGGNVFFGAKPILHVFMLAMLASGLISGLLPLLLILPVLVIAARIRAAGAGAGARTPRGGLTALLHSLRQVCQRDLREDSGFPANLKRFSSPPQESLSAGQAAKPQAGLEGTERDAGVPGRNTPLLLIVWAVPFLLFYSIVYIGRVAYCIACLPPILLLLSRWLVGELRQPDRRAARSYWCVLSLSVLINATSFFLVPRVAEPAFNAGSSRLAQHLPATLNNSILTCAYDQIRFDQAVKKRYLDEMGVILAKGDSSLVLLQTSPPDCLNFRILEYYFPDVPVYAVLPGFRDVLTLQSGQSPNDRSPFSKLLGAQHGSTLAAGKENVLLVHSMSQHIEVRGRNGGSWEAVPETHHDRFAVFQMYLLHLTPASSVDITSDRQTISIVE